jgi:hypothetical protein
VALALVAALFFLARLTIVALQVDRRTGGAQRVPRSCRRQPPRSRDPGAMARRSGAAAVGAVLHAAALASTSEDGDEAWRCYTAV